MSNEIYDNLVKEAIAAIKKGDLSSLKSVLGSELLDFTDRNLPIEDLIVLAATNVQKEIVEHLIVPANMIELLQNVAWALKGYLIADHFDNFKELLDRFVPYMKKNGKHINIIKTLERCIKNKQLETVRKIIKMFSVQPYSEISNYGSYDNLNSRLACECINHNCVELLDECFETAIHAKEKLDFEDALLIAKALNRDEIVKKLEVWKEKYPYQYDNNKALSPYSVTCQPIGYISYQIGC